MKPSSIYHALVAGVVWALTSPQRTQATSLPCAPTVCAASTAGARRSAWRTRLCGWKPLPGRDTVSRRFPSSLCVLREDMTCPGRPKCCRALLWTRGDAVSDSLTYCLSSNCSFPGLIGGPAARLPARIANTRPHHPHFSDSSSSLPALLTRALVLAQLELASLLEEGTVMPKNEARAMALRKAASTWVGIRRHLSVPPTMLLRMQAE